MLALAGLAAVRGFSAQAQEVSWRDVAWANPDGVELLARVYEPMERSGDASPVLLHAHPGIWNFGDRTVTQVIDEGLARAGFVVVAMDFRQGPDHQHPVSSRDITAAVRWVRLNAAELGADPERVGLMGSSSGGHLALLSAVRPDADVHDGTPIFGPNGEAALHDDIDASVDHVVALWAVSDPQARYRYAQRAGAEVIVESSDAYFGNEAAMLDASIPRIVTAGGLGDLPALLVVQSGMDTNIPAEMTLDLVRAYQGRDGKLEYAFYPNAAHVFGMEASAETDDLISLIADFARRRGEALEREAP